MIAKDIYSPGNARDIVDLFDKIKPLMMIKEVAEEGNEKIDDDNWMGSYYDWIYGKHDESDRFINASLYDIFKECADSGVPAAIR